MQKTTAEHGSTRTEEAQTLLSKTKEIIQFNHYPSKILYRNNAKIGKNQPGCNLIQKAVVIVLRSNDQQELNNL